MDQSFYKAELLKKELDEAFFGTSNFANQEQANFKPVNKQNFSNFDEKTTSSLKVDKMSA